MSITDALLLERFIGRPEELISILQYYQSAYGFISPENVHQIGNFLKLSEAHIFGVASFYTQFRFEKPGKNLIRACLGTACHVQGGEQLAAEIQNLLGIGAGEVTPDGRFEFQKVACLGCCAQAPLVEINGKVFGKMTPSQLRKVLEDDENL
jgi:NADH-quinone oxidoreductase subunit E